jgi:FtsZ-binding cell division protein ZapB
MGSAAISVDEFQALEQKVLQTVDLIKKERESRHTAEAALTAAQKEVAELKEQLAQSQESQTEMETLRREADTLLQEREAVRLRVDKMLATMDELL